MNDPVDNLVKISKYSGQRFDLIQAGGGNSSVKIDDRLLVKASGFLLSAVETDAGYVSIDLEATRAILHDPAVRDGQDRDARTKNAAELLGRLSEPGAAARPSIEAYLHAFLYRYTLHTHPLTVTALASHPDGRADIMNAFPDALWVPYRTPGIELALAMLEALEEYRAARDGRDPSVIFLANHGLIVSADDADDVIAGTEAVIQKLESILGVDYSRYRQVDAVAALVNEWNRSPQIAYLSDDELLRKELARDPDKFATGPVFPDGMVFFGKAALKLASADDREAVQAFVDRHGHLPRALVCGDDVFFMAANLKKAREIEEVFKAHLVTWLSAPRRPVPLEETELNYLLNWEAEKYRQKI